MFVLFCVLALDCASEASSKAAFSRITSLTCCRRRQLAVVQHHKRGDHLEWRRLHLPRSCPVRSINRRTYIIHQYFRGFQSRRVRPSHFTALFRNSRSATRRLEVGVVLLMLTFDMTKETVGTQQLLWYLDRDIIGVETSI